MLLSPQYVNQPWAHDFAGRIGTLLYPCRAGREGGGVVARWVVEFEYPDFEEEEAACAGISQAVDTKTRRQEDCEDKACPCISTIPAAARVDDNAGEGSWGRSEVSRCVRGGTRERPSILGCFNVSREGLLLQFEVAGNKQLMGYEERKAASWGSLGEALLVVKKKRYVVCFAAEVSMPVRFWGAMC